MTVSLIVAMSTNGVIGRNGQLPWHLAADLKRFRTLTMGHHILMGRKTYQSIGRNLPGRESIVITRQAEYRLPGATVAMSVPQALDLARDDPEPFVIGGAEIYRTALPYVNRIYLTRVEVVIEGDVYFPQLEPNQWRLVSTENIPADPQNEYASTFEVLERLDFMERGAA